MSTTEQLHSVVLGYDRYVPDVPVTIYASTIQFGKDTKKYPTMGIGLLAARGNVPIATCSIIFSVTEGWDAVLTRDELQLYERQVEYLRGQRYNYTPVNRSDKDTVRSLIATFNRSLADVAGVFHFVYANQDAAGRLALFVSEYGTPEADLALVPKWSVQYDQSSYLSGWCKGRNDYIPNADHMTLQNGHPAGSPLALCVNAVNISLLMGLRST